ncbi:hypothetical protein HWV23_11625 [Natronomonas halophila]|uniref:DUF7519 family protein n=1 Tax=Natronomonas halophila TaxID=2747817 RepID=UPI0015B46BB9|nr:hypothetical protein [Natronomonas halophila]QLD86345.1 hypothetical protein HWV23_11625 [Natronomonas halophila]
MSDAGTIAPSRPTLTAAAAALSAVLGTLVVAVAVDGTVPGLAGLFAGACLATAVLATAETDYGAAIPLAGVFGALGGLAGLAGPLAVAAVRVPWPPIPPIEYLPFAPFAAFGAAVLVGFGALTVLGGSPPTAHAGPAGSRVLVVAVVPAVALLVVAPAPPINVVVLAVFLVILAPLAARLTRSGGDEVRLGPSAFVYGGTGAALTAAVWPLHGRLGDIALAAAETESGRRALESLFGALGTAGAVLAVLTAALAVSGFFLLGVRAADAVGVLGGAAGVQLASLGVFAAAVAAAVDGLHPVAVFATVAVSLLVWDLGEFAATLGREVGRGGDTRRGELVHAVGALAVAGASVLAATAVVRAASVVPAAPSPLLVVATLAATVGTLLLFVALR